ncbi:predicted protein [Histoplasma capsulatum var. duboisii H88]|uniref:Predicted protein n=1 Tax=Ajellomyces capsulatus (strain H88) TaxID=544711 RepID=F0UVN8_AJEC8|nr:predicted protein [Histoplasma capsulatum var. duboisii H88]
MGWLAGFLLTVLNISMLRIHETVFSALRLWVIIVPDGGASSGGRHCWCQYEGMAKTGGADWSGVDVDTFSRLCEYALFTKLHNPPSFRLVNCESPSTKATEIAKTKQNKTNKTKLYSLRCYQKRFKGKKGREPERIQCTVQHSPHIPQLASLTLEYKKVP